MKTLQQRFAQVQQRIHDAAVKYGRQPQKIQLLAVSKTCPLDDILALAALGQNCFGENYLQEALAKIHAAPALEWHFIGPVQSNKTRDIADNFAWLHSLDRLKIARRLNDQRPAELAPLNVCLQINISAEASKAGIRPEAAAALCESVQALPRLRLRGLMALPAASADFDTQRQAFRELRILQEKLNTQGHALDTLSMGMSADLEAAIAEGATIVRIGTDLFGPRPTNEQASL